MAESIDFRRNIQKPIQTPRRPLKSTSFHVQELFHDASHRLHACLVRKIFKSGT